MATTKTTISISEARKRIFDIAEEVQTPNKVYTLTSDGKPKMVMMSAEDYESWIETMDILHESPGIMDRLKESEKEVETARKTGDWSKFITLEQLQEKWGLSDKKKIKKQNVISSRNSKIRSKTAR